MLRNLPVLRNDQTLYSWCGLTHLWNGLSPIATSYQLFGAPYTALLHDFPAHLHTLNENTGGQLGHPKDLALHHTLLGYFLPLADPLIAEGIVQRTFEGAMPEIKMKLGITASRVGGHHPLKGCPACFDEDESSVGFSYWHVSHQFPSVMVCERHHRPLLIAWDPVTPVHRRGWLLPRSGLKREWLEVPIDGNAQMDRLLRLATFSTHFSHLAPGSLNHIQMARAYQAALRGMRLATVSGSLRLATLVEMTRSHYRGMEVIPGFEALQAITPDWPGLAGALARQKPRHGHPLKHLLLIAMLFDTWAEFVKAYEDQKDKTIAPPNAASEPGDDAAIDAFCTLVSRDKLSIRAASTKVGISTTTGVKWAKLRRVPYTTRTKTLSRQKVEKCRKLLSRGLDSLTVANAVGVSRVSVNRLRSSDPDLEETCKLARFLKRRKKARERLTQLLQRYPTAAINELRRAPRNPYTWLYRNDRTWLGENLASLWKHLATHKDSSSKT
jgi:hypothetical protein